MSDANLRMRSLTVIVLGGLFCWAGCMGKTVHREPPAPVEKSEREALVTHLVGSWESPDPGRPVNYAVFNSNGSVTFKGGLHSYNPARWELNAERHELNLTFPSATNEALQVFQLYVGQGVKAFRPAQKQITYAFTRDTWTLNIAGWDYSKPDNSLKQFIETDPVIK